MKRSWIKRKPLKTPLKKKPKEVSRKILRKKLKECCSIIVKRRDGNICQKCGKYVEGSNCHSSHVIPVSFSLRLAYDTVNIKVLCFKCHIFWFHKNPLEAHDWFKAKFPGRYEYLMKRKKEIQSMGSVKTYELKEWLEDLKRVEE